MGFFKSKKETKTKSIKKEKPSLTEEKLAESKIEDLYALVKINFLELINTTEDELIRKLTLLAVGDERLGRVDVHFFKLRLAGAVDTDIVFEITGELHKPEEDKKPKRKKTTRKRKAKTGTKKATSTKTAPKRNVKKRGS